MRVRALLPVRVFCAYVSFVESEGLWAFTWLTGYETNAYQNKKENRKLTDTGLKGPDFIFNGIEDEDDQSDDENMRDS